LRLLSYRYKKKETKQKMPTDPYKKKPQHKEGLSYLEILQRAADRGDKTAQQEVKWNESKRRNLNSPHRSYKTGFKNGFY